MLPRASATMLGNLATGKIRTVEGQGTASETGVDEDVALVATGVVRTATAARRAVGDAHGPSDALVVDLADLVGCRAGSADNVLDLVVYPRPAASGACCASCVGGGAVDDARARRVWSVTLPSADDARRWADALWAVCVEARPARPRETLTRPTGCCPSTSRPRGDTRGGCWCSSTRSGARGARGKSSATSACPCSRTPASR